MLSALKPAPQWSPVSQQWRVSVTQSAAGQNPSLLIERLEYSQSDLTAFTKGEVSNAEQRRWHSRDGGVKMECEIETEEKIGFCDLQDVSKGAYWRHEI